MSPLVQALIATILVSTVSLVGVFVLFADWNERRAMLLVSFAAGVLLATTFLDLLPEAVERSGDRDGNFFVATLAAMAGFFMLERFLRGFHTHGEGHAAVSGSLVLIGDSVHNFIDGVVIGATFLANPGLGITATLAVAAHEIPQEIADYGILLSSGFSRSRALLLNFASGLFAVLGALVCFCFEGLVEAHLAWFMAATAGMFIYIAASDLIPELHHSDRGREWGYAIALFLGMVLIAGMRAVVPEAH